MVIKVKVVGPVSVKFRDRIGPFSWNRTVKTELNETYTLSKTNGLSLQKVQKIPGPFDMSVYVSVSNGEFRGKVKLVLDGTDLTVLEQDLGSGKLSSFVKPWKVRVNNVRGVTCDLSLSLETS